MVAESSDSSKTPIQILLRISLRLKEYRIFRPHRLHVGEFNSFFSVGYALEPITCMNEYCYLKQVSANRQLYTFCSHQEL